MNKIFSLVLLVAASVTAQTRHLSLDDAIQTGLQNSKVMQSSELQVDYAEAQAAYARTNRLPNVSLAGSYTRLSPIDAATVTFPGSPNPVTISEPLLNNYQFRVTAQQPLFTGFRVENTVAAGNYTADAAKSSNEQTRKNLIFNIRQSYWTLYKAQQVLKQVDENIELVKAHLRDAKNLMERGLLTSTDVMRIEVQLANAELAQVDARNQVRLSTIALNNTLGIPLDTPVELTDTVSFKPMEIGDMESMTVRSFESRDDLKSLRYQIRAAQSQVRVAQSALYPQIYLFGNVYYANPNQRIFPTSDKFDATWDVGVSVTMDLWNWGGTARQAEQARAQKAQLENALEQARDAVTFEITQSHLNVRQTEDRIRVAEKAVRLAEENYRNVNEKFKNGLALSSDLIDAEVALLQAKTNKTTAAADYEIAKAALSKALNQ
jgi:outer membrane protein TolC